MVWSFSFSTAPRTVCKKWIWELNLKLSTKIFCYLCEIACYDDNYETIRPEKTATWAYMMAIDLPLRQAIFETALSNRHNSPEVELTTAWRAWCPARSTDQVITMDIVHEERGSSARMRAPNRPGYTSATVGSGSAMVQRRAQGR